MSVNSKGSNTEKYAMSKNKLTGNSRTRKRQSPQSPAPPCAPQAITSTKASGGKNAAPAGDSNSSQVPLTKVEVIDFFLKLADQKNPNAEDVARLHQQIVLTPDAWSFASIQMQTTRDTLINKLAGHGAMRALLLAEVDILAKQLGCDSAPPLERMLIDHLLTVRLRLLHAETGYNQHVLGGSIPLTQAEFWDNLLSSTQARFLRAIETLARVRRLARNTPALQINIAREGGKQVNVQGDTHARNGHPAGNA